MTDKQLELAIQWHMFQCWFLMVQTSESDHLACEMREAMFPRYYDLVVKSGQLMGKPFPDKAINAEDDWRREREQP